MEGGNCVRWLFVDAGLNAPFLRGI